MRGRRLGLGKPQMEGKVVEVTTLDGSSVCTTSVANSSLAQLRSLVSKCSGIVGGHQVFVCQGHIVKSQSDFLTFVASDERTLTLLLNPVLVGGLDVISRSYALNYADNPIRGTWVSDLGVCHIGKDPESGRLAYTEPLPQRELLRAHAFLQPHGCSEGRLWWKAALHPCSWGFCTCHWPSWVEAEDSAAGNVLLMAFLPRQGTHALEIQIRSHSPDRIVARKIFDADMHV